VRIIDDYLTGPTPDGRFPDRVAMNVVFEVGGAVWQIRAQQERDAGQSYANLLRFSKHKGEWTTVATRKPAADYGIAAPGAEYSEHAFAALEEDYYQVAEDFEAALSQAQGS
jgi:hypothetical protein